MPHALSPDALTTAGQLMAFNWLVAEKAHPDWLGPWAHLLEPGKTSMRLLRRVSLALLERHDLQQRYLRQAEGHEWLFLPVPALHALAQTLGVAMLGGWVRNSLEREQIAQQLRVLTSEQRAAAMRYAVALQALPYPECGAWPLDRLESAQVSALGLSCLAELLTDEHTGSRQRFAMRFPRDTLAPLVLNDAQRMEARALIQAHQEANA